MQKRWTEMHHRIIEGVEQPPVMRRSWFYSPHGNMRDRHPHMRVTMPAVENVSDCSHWMPYEEGDEEPEPPV